MRKRKDEERHSYPLKCTSDVTKNATYLVTGELIFAAIIFGNNGRAIVCSCSYVCGYFTSTVILPKAYTATLVSI
jgi:hypothetical protein